MQRDGTVAPRRIRAHMRRAAGRRCVSHSIPCETIAPCRCRVSHRAVVDGEMQRSSAVTSCCISAMMGRRIRRNRIKPSDAA